MAAWGNTMIGQDDFVNQSVNRVRNQTDAAKAALIRQAGRMGTNPNSGAFMNMMRNAQYDQTAQINAAANDAQFKWLNAANDQYNRDRAAGMNQEGINNQSNQWWASFGAARDALKAKYVYDAEKYKNGSKSKDEEDPYSEGLNNGKWFDRNHQMTFDYTKRIDGITPYMYDPSSNTWKIFGYRG